MPDLAEEARLARPELALPGRRALPGRLEGRLVRAAALPGRLERGELFGGATVGMCTLIDIDGCMLTRPLGLT